MNIFFGLYSCNGDDTIGWTDSREDYEKYLNDGVSGRVPFKSESEMVYPRFREDKRGLELEINLREFYRDDCDEEWYSTYKELVEAQKKKENE